jgi:small-conductance mechanosensitive channel
MVSSQFLTQYGMRRKSEIAAGLVMLSLTIGSGLLAVPARAQAPADAAAESRKAAPEKPAAPTAIPLAEVSAQAEAATVNLREIVTAAAVSPNIEEIDNDLPGITREIEIRVRENARIMSQHPSIELLGTLDRNWRRIRRTLALWSGGLDDRIAALDRDLARVNDLDSTWKETLTVAQKENAPTEIARRIESLLAGIAKTRGTIDAQRAAALRLQSRVAAQDSRVREAVESIRQLRDATLARIGQKDSPALWNRALLARAGEHIPADSYQSRDAQWTTLQVYAARSTSHFLLHGLVFAALAALFYWARRRINHWAQDDAAMRHAASVFEWPIATALILSLIGSRLLYPEAPRLMGAFIGALALIPTVLVLRRIVAPYLLPLLYAVIAFFFVDQIRIITASIELVPRLVFFLEMVAGTVFLLWFLRAMKRAEVGPGERRRSVARVGVRVASAFFALTALANVIGYVALANLLGNAVLRSMYFGLILYTVVEILDALLLMAMRVKPLSLLSMVERHRDLLRKRTRIVLNALAFILWALFTLERLAVRERVLLGAKDFLTADLTLGSISISLADVIAFSLAVWTSFLVSRFVRFVLDEEVFPHARLKRGLPYAISRTLHYLILVAGFFVAIAALGLDMTKFTILAGAFSVGVGFGLQNIFNNFVSGLILLYERPVQVGDVIQMDDAAGVVERIGIRASIIRTMSGSEIIVPNGKLISERLVNWTFSDRQRGIEVPISVVLGTDPKSVIAILEHIAADHPKLLKNPPPQALLTRVGPDWMGFELHASTDRVEDWMQVRSEIAVAVTAALVQANITLR